jgi:hypothetical protein
MISNIADADDRQRLSKLMVLMTSRTCRAKNERGEPCRQAPLRDSEYCFWHSPEHAAEAAEARRLGGLRLRREKITAGAYDFDGLGDMGSIRRLLDIAVIDTLGLENSVARSRALAYLSQVAIKALEVGELAERVEAIEDAMRPRLHVVKGRR